MKKFKVLILINLLSMAFMLMFAGQAMAGAETAVQTGVQGIDVSRWQGVIDWDTADDHAGFAIIKAGGSDQGMYEDSQFIRNRDEARRVGITRGYYYYAGGGDPVKEAEHFASLVGELQTGEVLALDFEQDLPDPVGYSLQFLVRTEELTGAKPMFYTNMNRVWKHDWQPVVDNGNPLWGAIYDGSADVLPEPGSWPALAIKQYTSSGVIPGINSGVDLNVFPSKLEDFKAMGLKDPVLPMVEKLEVKKPQPVAPPEPVKPVLNDSWANEIQVADVIEPERIVAVVPVESQSSGSDKAQTLTIQWPSRRPAYIETSFEMDFAAALDS